MDKIGFCEFAQFRCSGTSDHVTIIWFFAINSSMQLDLYVLVTICWKLTASW